MKRPLLLVAAAAATLALALAGLAPAPAETVVYIYAALPGPVSNCTWFDDNLNDHSESAMIRLTDLLYNRAALPPGANVNVSQTATTGRGDQELGFTLNGRGLCAGAAAFHPEIVEATPTPE
jgi:hypothetical protein